MSKKKRPKSKQSKPLRRPPKKAAYPSPAERERIIQQRDELLRQLIGVVMLTPGDERDRRIAQLTNKYGPGEVAAVLDSFQKAATGREIIGEEAWLYREYRRNFARFGGHRPFLQRQEYEALSLEHALLSSKRMFESSMRHRPGGRERELNDLLLLDLRFAEDITPPAAPLRPADFESPPPGDYGHPVKALLTWGWDLNEQRIADDARNEAKWRPAIAELARMALDQGLLEGWPGEASSWAPYHALHMLGYLRAHEHSEWLLALLDRENDWLSDRLPLVWGQMGPEGEPALWNYLADRGHDPEKRGITLTGLRNIVRAYPKRRRDVIERLTRYLQESPDDDDTANGYVVHILDSMRAVEAGDAIVEAFEQEKVDLRIVQLHDIDFLEDRSAISAGGC